jgi:hypothetical protein
VILRGRWPARAAARAVLPAAADRYFEGLDAERAIAWRAADSFPLREFLGLVLPDAPPDHSTISRTRRLIDLETHEAAFTWMLQRLADAGLVKGTTVGIDATTLEANAVLRSIVRRDTGESYPDFLTKLAQASGIDTPTRARVGSRDGSAPGSRAHGRAAAIRLTASGSSASFSQAKLNRANGFD